jgi:hypothetical protein
MVLILFIVIGIIYIFLYFNKHSFKVSNNTVLAFTGGLGSGKTLSAVSYTIKSYNRAMDRYLIKKLWLSILKKLGNKKALVNLIELKTKKPYIFSNIPIKSKAYIPLTKEHLTLRTGINEYSTVLIDEVGQFASQYDWNKETVKNEFQEFVRFFRHYINGRLILTDQNSDNIAVGLRRRINVIYNLDNLQKLLPIPYFTLVRIKITPITVTEDIKNIKQTDVGARDEHWLWLLITKKFYESRCYKHRYDRVPYDNVTGSMPNSLYTNEFIEL